MKPKKLGKAILCRLLEAQVKRLRRKYTFQVVAVAGSAGKTSTKAAIADTLDKHFRVISQAGNYNDRLTVPLVLFGQQQPGIFNLPAWVRILIRNQRRLSKPFNYDVAVLELGTDGPGQLGKFSYLKPDILVLTSVAAEHMEFFGSLEVVAREELTPLAFSDKVLLNLDDIPSEYLPGTPYLSYGLKAGDYKLTASEDKGLKGQSLTLDLQSAGKVSAKIAGLGKQGAKIALAAAAVADMLGLSPGEIKQGIESLRPMAGRMRLLPGKQDSTLLDDTYNATPAAMEAALDVLQSNDAPQRIAILGSMNELGGASAEMHQRIGALCDPKKLDLVITIGQAASDQLAPAASQQGCPVKTFQSPYEAGEYAHAQLKPGALVLAKGSQNGVFAEEALKQLLANPSDKQKLVRQSEYWLKRKQKSFSRASAQEPS